MEKTLRRDSLKKTLPRILICFVLAIVLLAVTGFGIFRLIAGPTPISEVDADDLNGSYVSVDLSRALAGFATLSANDVVTKEYFVLSLEDGTYMAIAGRSDYIDQLEAAGDQAEDYFVNGTVETLTSMGTVSGTVIELDDELQEYLTSALETMSSYIPELEELAEEDALDSVILYSCLELGRVGFLQKTPVLILSLLALLFLVLGIVQLALVLSGFYQRQVRAVLEASGDAAAVEADFAGAGKIEHVLVGRQYLWYQSGATSHIIEISQIIWAYCQIEPLVVSRYRWPLCIWLRSGEMTGPHLQTQKNVKAVLAAMRAGGARFLEGYDAERSRSCNADFSRFLADADRELAEAEQASGQA